jgi:hypothetical protein
MKPITIRFALMISFCLGMLPSLTYAQNCSTYYPMEVGTRLEYEVYGRNGKTEGTQWQEVTSVTETSEGEKVMMNIGFSDTREKNTYETEYGFTCTGSAIRIDYQSLLSGGMLDQYEGMEMEISGTDIELPNNLVVGQSLPDARVEMTIKMSGINMKVAVDMTNRRVEKKESVTTPAGTFDCFVLYSESQSKMMMANTTISSRTWLAEGVGMVQSETYNKNGKLDGRMVLTSIRR